MPPLDIVGENHIPEAVRRSAARADEIARQAGVANVPPVEEPPAGDPPVEPPTGEAPPVTPPTTPTTPTTPPEAPQLNEWEQKYRTLQGKYDAEVPGLRSQVNGLQQVLANLETRSPSQPTKPDTAPVAPAAGTPVPAKDVEEYGQDLIDAVRRWTRAEVQPLVDELRTKLDGLGTNFQKVELSQKETERQTVVHNAREVVRAALDSDPKLGPVWVATNKDPGFIAWVQQADPFSGQVKQPLLQGAFDAGQVDRVKAFFNAYLSEHTATQAPAQAPAHTPPEQGTGRPTLEDFAAPGRGGPPTPPPGGASEKRTWTQPEIAAFYRDVQRGVYANREADKLRIEQDIIHATVEGRIRI